MENNKSVTAVEWLIEQLKGKSQSVTWNEIFNKAKEMEEQHIIDAYNNGSIDTLKDELKFGKQYYIDSFKKK